MVDVNGHVVFRRHNIYLSIVWYICLYIHSDTVTQYRSPQYTPQYCLVHLSVHTHTHLQFTPPPTLHTRTQVFNKLLSLASSASAGSDMGLWSNLLISTTAVRPAVFTQCMYITCMYAYFYSEWLFSSLTFTICLL